MTNLVQLIALLLVDIAAVRARTVKNVNTNIDTPVFFQHAAYVHDRHLEHCHRLRHSVTNDDFFVCW